MLQENIELPSQNENADLEFQKKINESKAKIEEAQTAPLKRGRGRPRKVVATPVSEATEPQMHASTPTPTPNMAPLLKTPLIAISKIPAVNYQIPELMLSEDEAAACAESLNLIIQAFVPYADQMDPKTAAIVSAASVFGSIGFQKYQIFQLKQAERIQKIREQSDNGTVTAVKPDEKVEIKLTPGSVPAEHFFRR